MWHLHCIRSARATTGQLIPVAWLRRGDNHLWCVNWCKQHMFTLLALLEFFVRALKNLLSLNNNKGMQATCLLPQYGPRCLRRKKFLHRLNFCVEFPVSLFLRTIFTCAVVHILPSTRATLVSPPGRLVRHCIFHQLIVLCSQAVARLCPHWDSFE